MGSKGVALLAASVIIGIACIRLGFWQLSRLEERRAYNAHLAARRFTDPVGLKSLPADTAEARFRRLRVTGRYDYGKEVVWAFRTRRGSPGVNILTPMRVGATDTLLLVNRGWVYSPDGSRVDLRRWREGDTATIDGYVQSFPHTIAPTPMKTALTYRALDRAKIERALGVPVFPYYMVLTTAPGADSARIPPRIDAISLDEGSHKSYAMQWFAFAAIALAGGAIFVRNAGKKVRSPT